MVTAEDQGNDHGHGGGDTTADPPNGEEAVADMVNPHMKIGRSGLLMHSPMIHLRLLRLTRQPWRTRMLIPQRFGLNIHMLHFVVHC